MYGQRKIMCYTPAFFVDLKKKVVSLKNVNNPLQKSGVFAGLFDLLCLKTRFFDDPGVKSSSKALDLSNYQPQQ